MDISGKLNTGNNPYTADYTARQGLASNGNDSRITNDSRTTNEKALSEYIMQLKNKIENGETETSYQIGGQSFTIREWDNVLKKIDAAIDKIKKEQEEQKESAEKAQKEAKAKGNALMRHIAGEEEAPYSELAENGIITYNGVTFQCDFSKNQITLGDMSDRSKCLTIPLSAGGSLVVNVDNIGDLAKAIGMFSPEDVRRILEAIATYNKAKEMKQEIDDEATKIGEAHASALVSESTLTTEASPDGSASEKRYITWYTQEGIYCREQGQTTGYLWTVSYQNKDDYEKVMSRIKNTDPDSDQSFARDENYWKSYLGIK